MFLQVEIKLAMLFLKLLLTGNLIFIAVMADENLKNLPILRSALFNNMIHFDLPDNVIPIHYNIKLIPFITAAKYLLEGGRDQKILGYLQEYEMLTKEARDMNIEIPERYYFYGQSNIHIKIIRATIEISLNALQLHIGQEATMVINKNNKIYIYKSSQQYYINNLQIIVLIFDDELSPGDYVLNMKFVGHIHDDIKGLFRSSYWNMGRQM